MTPFRVVFLTCALLTIGGVFYLSYNGIGRESADLDKSVRIGGVGGYSGGRVK